MCWVICGQIDNTNGYPGSTSKIIKVQSCIVLNLCVIQFLKLTIPKMPGISQGRWSPTLPWHRRVHRNALRGCDVHQGCSALALVKLSTWSTDIYDMCAYDWQAIIIINWRTSTGTFAGDKFLTNGKHSKKWWYNIMMLVLVRLVHISTTMVRYTLSCTPLISSNAFHNNVYLE